MIHWPPDAVIAATTRISASDRRDAPPPVQCIPPGESTSGGVLVMLPTVPCSCPATPGGPSVFQVPTDERFGYSSPITTVTFSPVLSQTNKQTRKNVQQLLVLVPHMSMCNADAVQDSYLNRSPLGRIADRPKSRTMRVAPTGTTAPRAAR